MIFFYRTEALLAVKKYYIMMKNEIFRDAARCSAGAAQRNIALPAVKMPPYFHGKGKPHGFSFVARAAQRTAYAAIRRDVDR